MMAKGAAWFDQVRLQHLSVSVSYLRVGSMLPLECAATLVDGKWETMDAAGQIVRMETRDFFINTDDLLGDPKIGDVITAIEDGIERTYAVAVPGGGQQAWRWADRRHKIRRIHTMEQSQEAVSAFVMTTELGQHLTTEAGEPLVA